ncbi:AAA family ATPase [Aeromonas veronii]|uniref:AAA family ATPase n=1 Tax=Aeromonas veronii TaxID=654 RepID=UPI0038E78DD3
MLDAIRLINLRSFEDSKFISLKPITILVGKNSSGKSTFLRTFPLLRQSVESKTKGPILWYGSYVDFGAFSEAKSTLTNQDTISFAFSLNLPPHILNQNSPLRNSLRRVKLSNKDISANVKISVSNNKGATVFDSVEIEIEKRKISIKYNTADRCTVKITSHDNVEIIESSLFYSPSNLIPPLLQKVKEQFFIMDENNQPEAKTITRITRLEPYEWLKPTAYTALKDYFYRTTRSETILSGIQKLVITNDNAFFNNLIHNIYRDNQYFLNKHTMFNHEVNATLMDYVIALNANNIIETINRILINSFKNTKYIAPLRSTAERYYRYQDLQVDEIDHTGSNLAMLLNSLTETERESFSTWTMEHFDFSVKAEESGLHYAIKIKAKGSRLEYNINDMGFGYSQILPIITSIWLETNKKNIRSITKELTFAIEQPELHLHPEFQAKLAKLFVTTINVAKDNNIQLRFIFETHSKTMIDAIGECVELKKITQDDVNVVIFDKASIEDKTDVKVSYFDEDGFLVNWPIGFFSGN